MSSSSYYDKELTERSEEREESLKVKGGEWVGKAEWGSGVGKRMERYDRGTR